LNICIYHTETTLKRYIKSTIIFCHAKVQAPYYGITNIIKADNIL